MGDAQHYIRGFIGALIGGFIGGGIGLIIGSIGAYIIGFLIGIFFVIPLCLGICTGIGVSRGIIVGYTLGKGRKGKMGARIVWIVALMLFLVVSNASMNKVVGVGELLVLVGLVNLVGGSSMVLALAATTKDVME